MIKFTPLVLPSVIETLPISDVKLCSWVRDQLISGKKVRKFLQFLLLYNHQLTREVLFSFILLCKSSKHKIANQNLVDS